MSTPPHAFTPPWFTPPAGHLQMADDLAPAAALVRATGIRETPDAALLEVFADQGALPLGSAARAAGGGLPAIATMATDRLTP